MKASIADADSAGHQSFDACMEPLHADHATSTGAIDLLRRQGHELMLVPQVLYEFWSVATRPVENNGLGMNPAEAPLELANLQRLFRLLRDERAVYPVWEQLVSSLGVRGKQAHDARLAAAMQRHAVTHLLTFNRSDFVRYTSIKVLEPVDIVRGSAVF